MDVVENADFYKGIETADLNNHGFYVFCFVKNMLL